MKEKPVVFVFGNSTFSNSNGEKKQEDDCVGSIYYYL
jgi:hypothetical protein